MIKLLNLLHDVQTLTKSRDNRPWSKLIEEVELLLADFAYDLGDGAYLPLPMPEKLTDPELKMIKSLLSKEGK